MKTPARKSGARFAALAAAVTVGAAASGLPIGPAQAAEGNVTDATFNWSVNDESTGGSYFGGCNFLVAGEAGDSGMARIWTAADAGELFPTDADGSFVDGNTSIRKSDGEGLNNFADRCKTVDGALVNSKTNAQAEDNHTGDFVEITGGTGTVDPETDTGTIEWEGSWTFAYYGGMTYWTISDPKLVVENGKGTITGTYSGYGTDMDDLSKWIKLDPVEGPIANLQNSTVDLTETGFEVTPDYLGVETDTQGRNIQDRTQEWWGAFPQEWIDFNVATGQDSYWYSTAGGATSIQPRKPTNPVEVTYSYEAPPEEPAEFEGATAHEVIGASEADGLQVEVEGTDYRNLPKTSTGSDAVGVYSAIIDREKPDEFTSADVLGAEFSYFRDTSAANSFTKVSTVAASSLEEAKEYDAVVWTAHGNGTEESVVYREPVELTDEQRDALFPGEEPTEEPTDDPTEEPTTDPTEEPTEEPTDDPTEEPTTDPTEEPTTEPTTEPTDDPTEDPTTEPTDDPTEEPTTDPTTDPTDEPAEPALGISPEEIGVSDFLDEGKGVTLTVDGLEPGTEVEFDVAPAAEQNVEPSTLPGEADEEGVASAVVYGVSAADAEDYLGEYSVEASVEEGSGEASAVDASAEDLSGTFSVVADDDAPNGGDDGAGDDGDDNGSDDGDDNGSDDDGAGDGSDLPRTGGSSLAALLLGVVTVGVGVTALFFTRRRRA
jgi:LPXTG-motif cell wall-anchored protein